MTDSPKSSSKLPQRQDTWYLAVRELHIWITPPGEEPYRPNGAMIVNLDHDIIQGFEIYPTWPTPEQVSETLFAAMLNRPTGSSLRPHRPKVIRFEDESLFQAIRLSLENIGVSAVFQPALEIADEIFSDLEAHMNAGPVGVPGLLSQGDVTPELGQAVFEAAALYHRAAPWVHLTNMQPLAIQVEPENEPRYAVLMGNGGVEYGLAMYKQWDDLMLQFGLVDDPMEMIPESGVHSLLFNEITRVPFDDLEAIAGFGWEVAGEESYPVPLIFTRDGEAKRPGYADLCWYEAAMRAIVEFVPAYLEADDRGDYHPARAEFAISTHAGKKKVSIEYPAGELPIENLPAVMRDWAEFDQDDGEFDLPGNFDRRVMEGSLSVFGSGFDDPREQEAQEIMYSAWEEQNPAKRIILAHQAIAVSPNCADAYVLLAEEEADTLNRALEFYQKGVAAGEKALGQSFFDENVGHFWGLLESRPYMRARAGLANTLWEMGKKEDALSHYREMLRLNPNDNQGIRYALLNLLMEINRRDEVDALLDAYADEWTSEWRYTQALRIFQKEGDSPAGRAALQEAQEQNPHVPDYLTGAKRIPNRLPEMISLGRESEAVSYAAANLNFWRKTPGAVAWLKEQTPSPAQKSAGKSKKKTRRGRRGKQE